MREPAQLLTMEKGSDGQGRCTRGPAAHKAGIERRCRIRASRWNCLARQTFWQQCEGWKNNGMAGRGPMLAHSAEDAMMRLMRVSLARRASVSAYVGSRRCRRADDIGKRRALVALDRLTRGCTEAAEHPVDRKQIGECDWQDRTQAQSCFCHGPEHANSSESKIRKCRNRLTFVQHIPLVRINAPNHRKCTCDRVAFKARGGIVSAFAVPRGIFALSNHEFIHAAAHQSD